MTNTNNPNLHTPDDPNDPDNRNRVEERDEIDLPVGIERRGYEKTIAVLAVIIVAIVFILIAFYYLYGYRTATTLPTAAPVATVPSTMPMSEVAPPGTNTAPITTAPTTTTTAPGATTTTTTTTTTTQPQPQ